MSHDVFISYSSHDKAVADAACATLEQHRIRCWIAPRDIVAGRPYGEALVEAISSARLFVLIFSDYANSSDQVIREVERAVSKGIPILPLRIEDVVPTKSMEYFLSSPHWLDAVTPPLERHLEQLAQNARFLLVGHATEAAPTPPQQTSARRFPVRYAFGVSAILLVVMAIFWSVSRWKGSADDKAFQEAKLLSAERLPEHGKGHGPLAAPNTDDRSKAENIAEAGDPDNDPTDPSSAKALSESEQRPVPETVSPSSRERDDGSPREAAATAEGASDPSVRPRPNPPLAPDQVVLEENDRSTLEIYETKHDGAGALLMPKPDFEQHLASTFHGDRLVNGTSVVVLDRRTERLEIGSIPWLMIQVVEGDDRGKVGWVLQRDAEKTQRTIRRNAVERIASVARIGESITQELADVPDVWEKNPSETIRRLRALEDEIRNRLPMGDPKRGELEQKLATRQNEYRLAGKWESSRMVFDLEYDPESKVTGTYYRKGGDGTVGHVDGTFQGPVLEMRFETPGGDGDMQWRFEKDPRRATVRWRSDGVRKTPWQSYDVRRVDDAASR